MASGAERATARHEASTLSMSVSVREVGEFRSAQSVPTWAQ
jgi:hypothetical protein